MPKLLLYPVQSSSAIKLIKEYFAQKKEPFNRTQVFGKHTVHQSELRWYVKAAYEELHVTGPGEDEINRYLTGRMCVGLFHVATLNSLVVEEMLPDQPLCSKLHIIDLAKATSSESVSIDGSVHSVRPGTAELLCRRWTSPDWFLLDIRSGQGRRVSSFGEEAYLSADGRFMFPVESWSSIGLVDLEEGALLDRKNKRHLSRFATKVKIIEVINFDPYVPEMEFLLMKRQDLSLTSLKKEVCVRLTVEC